ncbi:MAG: hypothetical protein [Cressdnaviricota sp.]|nr:MAG: hypothetical protein [Cressdnaviricota sp.]
MIKVVISHILFIEFKKLDTFLIRTKFRKLERFNLFSKCHYSVFIIIYLVFFCRFFRWRFILIYSIFNRVIGFIIFAIILFFRECDHL